MTHKIVNVNKTYYRDYEINFCQIKRQFYILVSGKRQWFDNMDSTIEYINGLYA